MLATVYISAQSRHAPCSQLALSVVPLFFLSLTVGDLSVTLSMLNVKHLYLLNEGAFFPQETVCFFAECIQYKSKYVPLLINKALGRLCLEDLLKVLITMQ